MTVISGIFTISEAPSRLVWACHLLHVGLLACWLLLDYTLTCSLTGSFLLFSPSFFYLYFLYLFLCWFIHEIFPFKGALKTILRHDRGRNIKEIGIPSSQQTDLEYVQSWFVPFCIWIRQPSAQYWTLVMLCTLGAFAEKVPPRPFPDPSDTSPMPCAFSNGIMIERSSANFSVRCSGILWKVIHHRARFWLTSIYKCRYYPSPQVCL